MQIKKIWNSFVDWVKRSGIYAIGGIIVGAILSARRTSADFERLRDDYKQLREQFAELEQQIEHIRTVKGNADSTIGQLEKSIRADGAIIDTIRGELDSGELNIDRLQETNDRLRSWIQKYGEQIEALSDND